MLLHLHKQTRSEEMLEPSEVCQATSEAHKIAEAQKSLSKGFFKANLLVIEGE